MVDSCVTFLSTKCSRCRNFQIICLTPPPALPQQAPLNFTELWSALAISVSQQASFIGREISAVYKVSRLLRERDFVPLLLFAVCK